MTDQHETGPSPVDCLTHRELAAVLRGDGIEGIDGMLTDDGRPTLLSLLLSDQCPFGISVRLPDGSVERISGSVVTQAVRASALINEHNPKRVVDGTKTPVFRFPRIAVKEALYNAVTHRDYSVPGDVEARFDDGRLLVLSPGESLPAGIRNPLLARIHDRCNVKCYGSYRGLTVIRRSYARSGYEPAYGSAGGRFAVDLPSVDEVRGFYRGKSDMVVRYLKGRSGGASLEEIAESIGYSQVHMRTVLSQMERDGTLMQMNCRASKRYYLCNRRRSSFLPHTGQNSSSGPTLE